MYPLPFNRDLPSCLTQSCSPGLPASVSQIRRLSISDRPVLQTLFPLPSSVCPATMAAQRPNSSFTYVTTLSRSPQLICVIPFIRSCLNFYASFSHLCILSRTLFTGSNSSLTVVLSLPVSSPNLRFPVCLLQRLSPDLRVLLLKYRLISSPLCVIPLRYLYPFYRTSVPYLHLFPRPLLQPQINQPIYRPLSRSLYLTAASSLPRLARRLSLTLGR